MSELAGAGARRTIGGNSGERGSEDGRERRAPACALVIFGASGDLTERKLLPAIRRLAASGRLRPEFALIGVARTAMSDAKWADKCLQDSSGHTDAAGQWAPKASFRYVSGGYDDPETYRRLREVLDECDRTLGTAGHRVFYLSTPPRLFGVIPARLGAAGLSKAPGREGWTRLVIEKPFGWDEASARDLYAQISTAFSEPQIFRIDHYLAKETVQNLLALRFANSIFEPIWNRTWVDNVQMTVSETLGVGSRGGFYDTTGAVRDIVQNHVVQVLSLFLMEPPTSFHPEAIRDEKVKLLRSIRPLTEPAQIAARAVRGQYTRGGTREDLMAGLPGRRRRGPAEQHRDLRRAEGGHRQLAVGWRAGVRPDRQAAAAAGHRGGHGVPAAAAAAAVPGRGRDAGTGRADRPGAAGRGHQPAVRRQGARP